jgi:uncharacterized protein (DUF1015 family)
VVERRGEVAPDEARPGRRGVVAVRATDGWVRLDLTAHRAGTDEVVFDAELLQDDVLAPVFGVTDATTDPRLVFVPDDRVDELVRRCVAGGAVGFVLAAAGIDDVLAVADSGRTVPPKSTWFRPKLPSGLVLHHLRSGTTGGTSGDRPDARSRA